MSIRYAMIALTLWSWADSAYAHGIAGNRYFAGTITFDDPAVADEAILPGFSNLKHPAQGGHVDDTRFNWSFDRLLTPTIAVTFDGGWVGRNWTTSQTSGLDTTNMGIKAEVFRNNRHEALLSAGLFGVAPAPDIARYIGWGQRCRLAAVSVCVWREFRACRALAAKEQGSPHWQDQRSDNERDTPLANQESWASPTTSLLTRQSGGKLELAPKPVAAAEAWSKAVI
jgi:hypothetical protein